MQFSTKNATTINAPKMIAQSAAMASAALGSSRTMASFVASAAQVAQVAAQIA
jgi:hypothetical protein